MGEAADRADPFQRYPLKKAVRNGPRGVGESAGQRWIPRLRRAASRGVHWRPWPTWRHHQIEGSIQLLDPSQQMVGDLVPVDHSERFIEKLRVNLAKHIRRAFGDFLAQLLRGVVLGRLRYWCDASNHRSRARRGLDILPRLFAPVTRSRCRGHQPQTSSIEYRELIRGVSGPHVASTQVLVRPLPFVELPRENVGDLLMF